MIPPMDRRTFMKVSAGAAAVAARANALPGLPAAARKLPAVPSLSDLASIRMSHNFMELFTLPIAQKDWGYAQAVKSVSAITAMAFPPCPGCGIPAIPWSPGLRSTWDLLFNARLASISDDPARAVVYQWFPNCVI